jgi:apolipoprotein N-acyltransferase
MLLKAIFAGALYFLSFPPFDYWYLIVPSVYFFYSSTITAERVFSNGFVFGSIAYGVILFGIQSIGYEAWIPLAILMGLMYGFYSKALKFIATKTNNNLFALVGVISGFGLLRSYFPFGGFPWGYSATVLLTGYQDNIFFLLVPKLFKTFGPIGYSLLLESFILFLYLLIRGKEERRNELKKFLIMIIIFAVPLIFSEISIREDITKEIEVSIIQGNSPCPGTKNKCENERQRIYENHLSLTKSLNSERNEKDNGTPRLIVWAESSSGFKNDPKENSETLNQIASEIKRLKAAFLIGGDRPSNPGEFENYGIFINENGVISGEYLKQHPVPFGEYIPFRKYLDWIPPLALVPRDMVRGSNQEVFTTIQNEIKISPVISFEGSFDRYIRRSVKMGAELVVILTNQASFGKSGMSDQFILMSRANAISNNRDIVHAAITGKSAFISGIDGDVYSSSGLFTDEVLTQKIKTSNTNTLYTKWGNYLNYLLIFSGFINLFLRRST